ncbi:unnamed protein product [Phytophthora lilii]|uniref:Unnamed protein product n=1 Tax=Phytophthora lilii TaxID=2077276 RepID=A0A9W6U934_9STRA|nr:unnamed protein product [Phytophthora lilii]
MLNNRHLGQGFFLAWKMIYVQARMCNAVKMAQHNECTRARLRLIEQEVRKRCALVKSDLNDIRLACTAERSQVQSLCEDVCQPEMPKLIELVENQRRNFSNQMRCLEAQLENQREHSQNQEERLKMAQQDADLHARMILEDHQAQLRNQKLKKHIISQALAALKRRESQRRTFNAWKEIYLRSLVGQATHTAMVFRSQHPQVASTVECGSPRGYNPSLPSAAILPAPAIAIQSLQSVEGMKVGADSISRSPVPDDTLWRKWRRVDAGTAGRGLKPRPITRALPS